MNEQRADRKRFKKLLRESSLGSPGARALMGRASRKDVKRILAKIEERANDPRDPQKDEEFERYMALSDTPEVQAEIERSIKELEDAALARQTQRRQLAAVFLMVAASLVAVAIQARRRSRSA